MDGSEGNWRIEVWGHNSSSGLVYVLHTIKYGLCNYMLYLGVMVRVWRQSGRNARLRRLGTRLRWGSAVRRYFQLFRCAADRFSMHEPGVCGGEGLK